MNQRRSGRLACEELRSDRGPVIDLSGSGCRVLCNRLNPPRVGTLITLRLRGYGESLELQARVVRRSNRGFLATELGFEFVSPSEECRASIAALARTYSVRYAFMGRAA